MTDKVFLNGVAIELGLDAIPYIQALNKILHFSLYNGLNIYFDNEINGARTDGEIEEILDNHGQVAAVMVASKLICCTGKKILIASKEAPQVSEKSISITEFIHENTPYYTTDYEGMFFRSQETSLINFYCLASELKDFISHNTHSPTGSTKTKKLSKQEQREKEFRGWLTQDTNNSCVNFNNLYNALGKPTQLFVWTELQKQNPKLFAQGKDDFFRNQKIIDFELGTSKGR